MEEKEMFKKVCKSCGHCELGEKGYSYSITICGALDTPKKEEGSL